MKLSKKLCVISLLPLLLLMLGSIVSGYLIRSNAQATRNYIMEYVDRQIIISDIYQVLGYGSGIHDFKNYVLRGQKKYKKNAIKNITKANSYIDKYMSMRPLANEEIAAMKVLRETIGEYLGKIEVVEKMRSQKETIRTIDKAVQVDDGPAVRALKNLQEFFLKKRQEELQKLEETQQSAFIIIMVICTLAFLIAIFMSRKISLKMIHSIQNLIQLSLKISQGDYSFDKKVSEKFADDELRTLYGQMIGMQKNLDQSFNKLQKLNEDIERFAYITSHDLQEPVKKISIFASLLESDETTLLSVDGTLYLEKIKSTSKDMKKLINDLLEYARSASKEANFEGVNLNDIVKKSLESFETSIMEGQVEVIIDNLPTVFGNKEMLLRLFNNLISNAIKFKREDVKSYIKIIAEKETDQKWIIRVRDNGVGFDLKHVDTILKPFGRAHNKKQYSGTGIGLAACARVLVEHNTKFDITSYKGSGSTFSFSLLSYQHKITKANVIE